MAFWAAGKALQAIRDGRLYRETHPTFEAYVEQEWQMTRQQAYRLIAVWPLAERLSPMGDKLNERQVRELLPVVSGHGQDAAVTVYRTAVEAGTRKVTAELLHEVVAILPGDRFDPAEAAERIRAYLAGEPGAPPPPPPPPQPGPEKVFAAGTSRVERGMRDVVDSAEAAASADPARVRKFVADVRAMLEKIEQAAPEA
jgi:hypothetical protein